MQIIVNCFTTYHDGIVMLKKPRRGWWVLPGGKVDVAETWLEAAKREMLEESGLNVSGLCLRGIHLLSIASHEAGAEPTCRLIAQFSAESNSGDLLEECKEGQLGLVTPEELLTLPMDEGDRQMVRRTLESVLTDDHTVYFGKFIYTAEHQLLHWSLDAAAPDTWEGPLP